MPPSPCATYSLILRDPQTGWIGSAVASKYLAVGPAVSHSIAGIGVVHSQFWNNHDLASRILKHLAWRMPVKEALDAALKSDPLAVKRQVLAMNWTGQTAVHTGSEATSVHAQHAEQDLVAAGNTLASEPVLEAMLRCVRNNMEKPLMVRLILALEAGESRGGDSRGKQSAAVRVVQGAEPPTSDDTLDLRVDDHPAPLDELRRLYLLAYPNEKLPLKL